MRERCHRGIVGSKHQPAIHPIRPYTSSSAIPISASKPRLCIRPTSSHAPLALPLNADSTLPAALPIHRHLAYAYSFDRLHPAVPPYKGRYAAFGTGCGCTKSTMTASGSCPQGWRTCEFSVCVPTIGKSSSPSTGAANAASATMLALWLRLASGFNGSFYPATPIWHRYLSGQSVRFPTQGRKEPAPSEFKVLRYQASRVCPCRYHDAPHSPMLERRGARRLEL
jgi:hypothetical protein